MVYLFFVHYNVNQSRYFLNNWSLLDALLRIVCLLMVLHHDHRPAECRYIFWSHMFFNDIFYIASHGAPIYCFFWTSSFLFLQTFLLINSMCLCFDPCIFCHLLANYKLFPNFWLFLVFFGCCECWLRWISCVMCHTRRE